MNMLLDSVKNVWRRVASTRQIVVSLFFYKAVDPMGQWNDSGKNVDARYRYPGDTAGIK